MHYLKPAVYQCRRSIRRVRFKAIRLPNSDCFGGLGNGSRSSKSSGSSLQPCPHSLYSQLLYTRTLLSLGFLNNYARAFARGGPVRNRTEDRAVMSRVLCRLSYRTIFRTWQATDSCQALPVYPGRQWKEMREVSNHLEPATGIGPAYSAWKADVLPLNYTDRSSAPGEW